MSPLERIAETLKIKVYASFYFRLGNILNYSRVSLLFAWSAAEGCKDLITMYFFP